MVDSGVVLALRVAVGSRGRELGRAPARLRVRFRPAAPRVWYGLPPADPTCAMGSVGESGAALPVPCLGGGAEPIVQLRGSGPSLSVMGVGLSRQPISRRDRLATRHADRTPTLKRRRGVGGPFGQLENFEKVNHERGQWKRTNDLLSTMI